MNKIKFAGDNFVWSSTFRRQNAFAHPSRLKAGLRTVAVSSCASFMLAGLVILAATGCERQSNMPVPTPEPAVTFKPQEMADALQAVIAADQKTYALQGGDENLMALHAQRLRQASESVQQEGAEFHYVLRSLWPINPRNAPETDTEKPASNSSSTIPARITTAANRSAVGTISPPFMPRPPPSMPAPIATTGTRPARRKISKPAT